MDINSPQCPYTVTVRRNPPRRARPTPTSSTSHVATSSSSATKDVTPFPIDEILLSEISEKPNPTSRSSAEKSSEMIRVFLRIRPLNVKSSSKRNGVGSCAARTRLKRTSPKQDKGKRTNKGDICLCLTDSHSVTLFPPQSKQDTRRHNTVLYDGFSHVFEVDSHQKEVYERVMDPLVSDFINGKSGLLAAIGPTGSGKTHTVFGCPREPGLVPLALRKIFELERENSSSKGSRSYFITMIEILSEGGKGERISDLCHDGVDLVLQQSTLRGVQEVLVSNASEAEALIACGMLKRATAATMSNSQSSRSHCIINIRTAPKNIDGNVEVLPKHAVLTIVDLAGAEREKKTGNQGTRLKESNFINNTSMVFGQCLRSLLEHQKNPKKQLQKHFRNSSLTTYLREYLEGKKRMTLILTVKPGVDDYDDTFHWLKQASPLREIKFTNTEEPSTLPYLKRQTTTLPRVEQPKRRKLSDVETFKIGAKCAYDDQTLRKEVITERCKEIAPADVPISSSRSPKLEKGNVSCLTGKCCTEFAGMERREKIMHSFSRALWNVLKEYKAKLEESEIEVQTLQRNLEAEKARYLELDKELTDLKSSDPYLTEHSKHGPSSTQVRADGLVQLAVLEPNKLEVDENSCSLNTEGGEYNTARCDTMEDQIPENSVQTKSSILNIEDSCLLMQDLKQKCQIASPLSQCSSQSSKQITEKENDAEGLEDLKSSEIVDNFLDADSAEPMTSSCQLKVLDGDDRCLPMEQRKLISEDEMAFSASRVSPTPNEESVEVNVCDDKRNGAECCSPCGVPCSVEKKPRRRLLPASSILLKEINDLVLDVENVDPKVGNRGGRKLVAEGRGLSDGSVCLLRLLRSNLHL